MIDDSTKMTNVTDVDWCDVLQTVSCLAEDRRAVREETDVLAKHKSTRRTAAKSKEQTGAPISYTSAQKTSVYEDLVALLRGVAIRWCEHWHLQLPSMMSDALNAFKSGGEVEAPTSESTYHDVLAVKGLCHNDQYIEELTRPLSS